MLERVMLELDLSGQMLKIKLYYIILSEQRLWMLYLVVLSLDSMLLEL